MKEKRTGKESKDHSSRLFSLFVCLFNRSLFCLFVYLSIFLSTLVAVFTVLVLDVKSKHYTFFVHVCTYVCMRSEFSLQSYTCTY